MNQQELIQLNKTIFSSIENTKKDTAFDKCSYDMKGFKKVLKKEWFQSNFFNINKFIQAIDTKHPELPYFLQDGLGPDFVDMCNDISMLHNIIDIRCKWLAPIKEKINKSFYELCSNTFNKSLNDPKISKSYVRFLSANERWEIRAQKQPQQIFKKSTSKSSIMNIENGIQCFAHNSGGVESLFKNLQQKKIYFEEMNCHSMSKEILLSLDKITENLVNKKYGFYRISISNLINIVCNIFDFDYAEVFPITSADQIKSSKTQPNFIKICETFFGKNYGIFDHYAEIKFSGISYSYLVGEIDQKTYFMGIII